VIPLKDINPTSTTPFVILILVGICVTVFFYQFFLSVAEGPSSGQAFVYRYGVVPFEISHGVDLIPQSGVALPEGRFSGAVPNLQRGFTEKPVEGVGEAVRLLYFPIVFSIFLHGGVLHLGFNMLFLWIFGNNVEEAMGHLRFLVFYLICGIAASLFHIVTNLNSPVPTIGASGAIAGVMGAYIVLYPHARVLTLIPLFFYFTLVELPAYIFLGIWFILQLLMSGGGGEVAWFAHIGGFIVGLILVKKFVCYSPLRHYGR
jgi:membrane associated rhomboid family serine protease